MREYEVAAQERADVTEVRDDHGPTVLQCLGRIDESLALELARHKQRGGLRPSTSR